MPKPTPLGEGGGGTRGSSGSKGPTFTDYAQRRYTNDLTKEELKAEHKWRMKNDMDYKHEQAVLKAAKAKGTQSGHAVTSVDRKTGKPN